MGEKRYPARFRRNLPHIQVHGQSHFVTFKTKQDFQLTPAAKDITMRACFYWHGKTIELSAVCVMSNHVHMMVELLTDEQGESLPLGQLLHSIKSYSAHRINKLLGRRGSVWLDERFDHIPRSDDRYAHQVEYIWLNAWYAKLVRHPDDYRWVWKAGREIPSWILKKVEDEPLEC